MSILINLVLCLYSNLLIVNDCYNKMIHGQHLKTTPYTTPLFNSCVKAHPYSQPNTTSYLLLHAQELNSQIYNHKSNKFICMAFQNAVANSCFIVLQGECFDQYVQKKVESNSYPILTEEQIWSLITSMCEAFYFLTQKQSSRYLTHFKQYCIRKINTKNIYKLIYHDSMVRQLDAAKNETVKWDKLYLSPEQLNGQFIYQKSIVFSFGLLLLDLCANQHRKISFYVKDQYKINEQVIRNKITIAQSKYGYSNLLCNFIKQCLVMNPQNRCNFQELRQLAIRKLQRQYMRKSQILSQINSFQKGKSIKYDIILPPDFKKSISYTSPSKKYSDINVTSFSEKQQSPQSDQIQSQIKKLQKSSAKNSAQNKSLVSSEVHQQKKLQRKQSKKFQVSRVSNNKNQSLIQTKLDKKIQNQKDQLQNNKVKYNNFQYRGTFGARNLIMSQQQKSQEKPTKKSRFKKQSDQDKYARQKQRKENQKQNEQNKLHNQIRIQQNQAEQREKLSDSNRMKKRQVTIHISFNQNQQKSRQHSQQEVQTPKGFGKFSFHQENMMNSRNEQQLQKQFQVIPELKTKMKLLSLDKCLRPTEDIAKDLNKIGVWVEGDLYYGDFVNGRRNGLGLELFANHQYYYGYFKEDLFSGEGFYYWNQRQFFFGNFELGQKVQGRLQGQIQYQGQFKDNKRHGKGVCWYPTDQIYSGFWHNGKRHGFGVLLQPQGQKFVGNWIKGKRKGQGYLQTETMRISGYWNDEIVEGQTQIEYKNGDIFRGKTGPILQKLNGQYISKSGRIFRGQFQDDYPKKGELIYSNGDKYIGELHNNRRHGYGEYYYTNGEVYKGQWQNNMKMN